MTNAEIRAMFELDGEELKKIADNFAREMRKGLLEHSGSLKMLPSYLDVPTGQERGNFLAVDFGGSNVRVLMLKISGREYEIVQRSVFSLRDSDRDFTSAAVHADELFDYIAGKIKEQLDSESRYYLGHTFSFPCRQEGVRTSYLINWTKEIKTAGVEGRDVGELLAAALERSGVFNVENNVILNDTVGTLLTTAMTDADADIGSICGTGHNTCYRDMHHPLTGAPMIVNMESGNFNKLEQNYFDKILDARSGVPGTQILEKMVSGHYLGLLAGIVLSEILQSETSVSSADVSAIVEGGVDVLETVLKPQIPVLPEPRQLLEIADIVCAIARRSARLVGATFAGVLLHNDPEVSKCHTIAVDGSLYEKMPYYPAQITEAVCEVLPQAAGRVRTVLSKDGSGVGAAVAAAAATGEKQ